MDDLLDGTENYTDKQFEVIQDTFRWNFGNYMRLPAITENERLQSDRALSSYSDGIREFVHSAYTDTPVEVRDDVCSRVVSEMERIRRKVGNYFYPQFLYPSDKQMTPADVAAAIQKCPLVGNASTKFSTVASLLNDKQVTKASATAIVEAFAFNESFVIASAVQEAMRPLFDLGKGGRNNAYMLPPEELQKKHKALQEELVAAAKKAAEERPGKSHAEMVKDILDDARVEMIDGLVLETPTGTRESAKQDTSGVAAKKESSTSTELTRVPNSGMSRGETGWVIGVGVMLSLIGGTVAVRVFRTRKGTKGSQ